MRKSTVVNFKKNYGYLYYSTANTINDTPPSSMSNRDRKRLNAIYDLRGSINLIPVIDGHAGLEITDYSISTESGQLTMKVGS